MKKEGARAGEGQTMARAVGGTALITQPLVIGPVAQSVMLTHSYKTLNLNTNTYRMR